MSRTVSAEAMKAWSILTAGPRSYLAEIPTVSHGVPSRRGHVVGVAVEYDRAYVYIEQIDLQQGSCVRVVLPMGLIGSNQTLRLVADSERSLAAWDDKDRQTYAALVNEAERTRAGVRADARVEIERPSGLLSPNGGRARQ